MNSRETSERIAARLREARHRQQRREFIVTTVALSTLIVVIAGWALGWFATDITLESSDGRWADRESLREGRDYRDSVVLFMQYRIECDADEAELYRVTRRPWWNPLMWPSLLADDKWSIPWRRAQADVEPTGIPEARCAPVTGAWERADRQARAYLETL